MFLDLGEDLEKEARREAENQRLSRLLLLLLLHFAMESLVYVHIHHHGSIALLGVALRIVMIRLRFGLSKRLRLH